jgi:hypothetical protein
MKVPMAKIVTVRRHGDFYTCYIEGCHASWSVRDGPRCPVCAKRRLKEEIKEEIKDRDDAAE